MTHSAWLSLCGFYVGFGCADSKSGCDPIENIPRGFDCVGNFVWCGADAGVSLDDPITLTSYPVICSKFHIQIPTNLGPGYASEMSHLKA